MFRFAIISESARLPARMVDWPPTTPQLASLGITSDIDDTSNIIKKIRSLADVNKLTFHTLSVSLILELR